MTRSGIRSRTGCFTCRQRKKKCNEERPICSGCKRNCLECYWPAAEGDRGSVKKASKAGKSGVVWRSLHPSGGSTSAAGATEHIRGQVDHTASGGPHDDAVTIALARSDSQPPASRGSAQIQSPPASLPAFMTLDFASPQAESQAGSSSTASRGWVENDGETFRIDEGGDVFLETDGNPRGSFSSNSGSSFGHRASVSSPGGAIHLAARPAHTNSDVAHADQGNSGIVPEDMFATGNEPVNSHTTHDLFNLLDNSELGPEAPEPATDAEMSMALTIPGRVSVLPEQDPDAFHLLSYYLSRTANSMGNGSTDSNPFVSTLIPLAFSNQLVLQLLLAQSAVHRQVGENQDTSNQVAHRYYTGSLRMFRTAIREYISGKSTDKLILSTGSLILSLTEVARGDIDGNIFDHIIAAKSLLVELFADGGKHIPQHFMDFLVEYYTHMSVLSMISVDPQHCTNPLLDATIERLARKLIEKKYIGQLTGCWLELLLAIPHIFDLGQRMRNPERPSADDMMMFSLLQAQITAYEPASGVSEETRLAALIFQKAILLYLWTILGLPQDDQADGLHSSLIKTTVAEAITLLQQIPATSRVNTSLLWPVMIVGCCTADRSLQDVLRTRLQAMFSSIRLGNMGETLLLLELVWAVPSEQRSPWVLCEVMQEHQRWVSFA